MKPYTAFQQHYLPQQERNRTAWPLSAHHLCEKTTRFMFSHHLQVIPNHYQQELECLQLPNPVSTYSMVERAHRGIECAEMLIDYMTSVASETIKCTNWH